MTEQVKHYETKPILTKAEFIEKYKAIIDIPDDKLKDSKMNYSTIQKTFPQITSEEVKTIALLRMEKHRKEIIDWSREQVAFLKEVVKANVPVDAIAKTLAPASISSPAPFEKLPTEAKGIDLSINIPEKAKKFGVTPNMVELLTKYGITATFIPAWRDGGSASNDRINMKKKGGDVISLFTDRSVATSTVASINLMSNNSNEPLDKNPTITEITEKGKTMLYIKAGPSEYRIKQDAGATGGKYEIKNKKLVFTPDPIKPTLDKIDYTKSKEGTKTILTNPSTKDGELNDVPGMPGVSFVKYKDPKEMNKRFGKITAFTEKGTTDFKEKKSWNYAGGHDLSSESIADFFNKNFGDTEEAQYFIKNNLISEKKNGKYTAIPNKAVLVMSYDVSMSDARKEMMISSIPHELAHGLYFTNPEFKTLTDSVWNGLAESQKKLISEMLKKNYQNPVFHATEFLSYILFTGDKDTVIDNLVGYTDINKDDPKAKQTYIDQKYTEIITPLKQLVIAKISSTPNLSHAIKDFIDSNKV